MARCVFRVCRARHARLDGEGARRVGGRWNSAGLAVVYMAQSVALAVLENLVHMSREDFPSNYVCVAATIPDGVQTLSEAQLRTRPELRTLNARELGDRWIQSCESAVLQVPSVIVPSEHNYLLNPAHPEFAAIVTEPPALFHFDPRLCR